MTGTTSCRTCTQALTPTTNVVTGVVQLIADDGWGTICGTDPTGEHTPDDEGECHDVDCPDETGPAACHGALELTVSKSGETRVLRCAAHAAAYHDRMDALEADIQRRFPGYDNPASCPPPWFDASYAGERWDDD